jgi:hypothetical protein
MKCVALKHSFLWAIAALLTAMLFPACDNAKESGGEASKVAKDQHGSLETDYRCLQAELRLAEADVPYLVLDIARMKIEIRLRGAIVWEEPIQVVEGDASVLTEFVERFRESTNGTNVRFMAKKQLFAAQDRFADSILTVVSGVLKVDAELMQRELPARFQLDWGDGLILRFRTETEIKSEGGAAAWLKDLFASMKDDVGHPVPVLEVKAERALTLFRVAHSGLPTLLVLELPPPVADTKPSKTDIKRSK